MTGRKGVHTAAGYRDAIEVAFQCFSIGRTCSNVVFKTCGTAADTAVTIRRCPAAARSGERKNTAAVQAAAAPPSNRCSSAPHVNVFSMSSGTGRALAAICWATRRSNDVGRMRTSPIPFASSSHSLLARGTRGPEHPNRASSFGSVGSGRTPCQPPEPADATRPPKDRVADPGGGRGRGPPSLARPTGHRFKPSE